MCAMKNMLSIIVPHYCTPEELFRKCISSIIDQDFCNMEVIVIDDGSPEDNKAFLNYLAGDNRVRVIYADHKGVSAARNRGIDEARGQYVMFVDADDYLDRSTLARIAAHLPCFTGDVIIFNGGLEYEGGVTKNSLFLRENVDYGKHREDKISIMESALSAGILPKGYVQTFSLGSPCCKLLRKEFLDQNHLRFDEEVRFAEDVLFLMNVYQMADSIFFYNWYLYNYVVNIHSATRNYRPGVSKEMDVFFQRMKDFLEQYKLMKDLEKAFYLRAQFEVDRSFCLEFFHLLNQDRNARKHYKDFIGREPYKTALGRDYLPRKTIRQKIFGFLVMHGYGDIYRLIRKLKT